MAVQPFYVCSKIEGRQTDLHGGPRSKDQGMRSVFTQRDRGSIIKSYEIECHHRYDGATHYLVTEVYFKGELIHSFETVY